MAARRRRRSKSLAAQSFALGMAAPQVIAHRMARMAAGDHSEVRRMGTEKIAAANEAWTAMATQAILENQKLAFNVMRSFWFPWTRSTPNALSKQLRRAGANILGEGIAPVRRRAVANAKRLRRIKPR